MAVQNSRGYASFFYLWIIFCDLVSVLAFPDPEAFHFVVFSLDCAMRMKKCLKCKGTITRKIANGELPSVLR